MVRSLRALLVAALAVTLVMTQVPTAYAADGSSGDADGSALSETGTAAATQDGEGVQDVTSSGSDQVSPLLVTEVQTDSSGYTYVEVFNNSDAPLNFKDYVFYYCYESGMGTGKTFGADASFGSYQYGSGDTDLFIEPGASLVLWFDNKGKTDADFNAKYGTNLTENKELLHIPYSGIHNSAKRGYFFGKDADSVMVRAWSNAEGDEIPQGNPDGLSIQYAYPGQGRDCVDVGTAKASPGSVDPSQVPAARVHAVEQQAEIKSAKADGSGTLKVTAEIPYEGTSATTFATLHWRQSSGDTQTDYQTLEMASAGDGKTFMTEVPADQLFGDKAEWYVTASGGTGTTAQTDPQTTGLEPQLPTPEAQAPFYVTEVHANPQGDDGKQYSYFEVYNDSDKPIRLSYFKVFYYYNYPAQTAAESGKTWTLNDFTAELEPGGTMVYWLSSNGTTIDDFNAFYGTSLEEGKDIVQVNYAGLHATSNRWIRFGTSEDDAFTVAGFNLNAAQRSDKDTSLQFAAPHGDGSANASIPVEVSAKTPGSVADWQKCSQTAVFQGYSNYPADDGQAPTLAIDTQEPAYQLPESIDEGDALQVMYSTDLLLGATSDGRRNAFKNNVDEDNPTNYPGGDESLAERPYLIGTEILYKLDDAADWTSVKQKTQWRLGHFLMQIPSDVLFGHDKVSYKVRAYTLYGVSESPEETVTINRLNDVDGLRLSVQDGDILSGQEAVSANDGGNNADTVIAVDGAERQGLRMLEDGAWFMVQTSGMNNYFKNAVTAPLGDDSRDILTILGPWCEASLSRAIHVGNEYFAYNEATDSYDVTLTLWAGNSGTPFEEIYPSVANTNHEDYSVTGLQLKLANGKAFLPTSIAPDNAKTNTSTALDASHIIGDSAGMETHLDATFSVPAADVEAVGVDIDTTALEDGAHTVSATSGTAKAEAAVIVDNTDPTIDFGIEPGATLYDAFALSASALATDANGIDQLEVSLDGEPLDLPADVVPHDLAVGEHTLRAVAIDAAGNLSTSEVTFNTEEVDPDVVVDDADGDGIGSESAKLSVDVADGPADVSFLEGRSLTQENGEVVLVGGSTSSTDGSFPYQLYSVNAGQVNTDDELTVTWSGEASAGDAGHPLSMFAYDFENATWENVGIGDESGLIKGVFSAQGHVQDGKAAVLVQRVTAGTLPDVKAPDQTALSGEQALEGAVTAQSDWDGTGRPESYDFSFAWETDTQYYSESFPYHYDNMNQWIVDNAQDWGIRYVLHTGDIVDDVDMTGEWINADHSMKIFDDAGMPYGVLGGNHDVFAGMEGYGNYWKYFGEDRFASKDYYGGSYKNNLGHYDLLSENGQDFIVLYMSWDIYTDEINWMNEVLAQYPDRKAVIALHRYANVKAADSLLDYTGQLLQEEVVAKNPNVFAVLNGHYHGASIETTAFDDNGDGSNDRTVYQICTDYQSDPEGGSEYIKFLYFDLQNNKVYLNSYSPYRDDFNYYDTAKQPSYAAGTIAVDQDIVELDVPFNTDEKTIASTSVKADVLTQSEIGKVYDATGAATFEWTGLSPETTYGWYAKVTNDKGGIVTTDVQTFTTEAAIALTPDPNPDQSLNPNPGLDDGGGTGLETGGRPSGNPLVQTGDTALPFALAVVVAAAGTGCTLYVARRRNLKR